MMRKCKREKKTHSVMHGAQRLDMVKILGLMCIMGKEKIITWMNVKRKWMVGRDEKKWKWEQNKESL